MKKLICLLQHAYIINIPKNCTHYDSLNTSWDLNDSVVALINAANGLLHLVASKPKYITHWLTHENPDWCPKYWLFHKGLFILSVICQVMHMQMWTVTDLLDI